VNQSIEASRTKEINNIVSYFILFTYIYQQLSSQTEHDKEIWIILSSKRVPLFLLGTSDKKW
jgi:hypothetical protein